MLEEVLVKWGGTEVDAMEVYSDIFKLEENKIQNMWEERGMYKANPLGYWKNGKSKGHYRIFFRDTFEAVLCELQQADFAIVNGITYFGRKNLQEHASKMYAMIFDLDGVTDKTLNAFLSGAFSADIYPIPNYVALSGHGVHLYYVFEEPIPLYPNIKLQLKALKYALTEKIWNQYTSIDEKKQFQGINQGFRVIGGKTKIDGVRVRAFRINQHPFNLEQMGKYVDLEYRVDEKKLWKERKMSLAEAKKKYPEWYESCVVGKKNRQYWTCKVALYEWWKRKIKEGATFHHRYFAVMCLAIYGAKCNLSYEKVKEDAFSLVPFLNAINPDEPFTENDCLSALECHDKRYCTFPIEDIVNLSGIEIKKNARNGRSQKEHLQEKYFQAEKGKPKINPCRANRELALQYMYSQGLISGRPSKEDAVMAYLKSHPDEKNVSTIARRCNVSRNTVYKYIKQRCAKVVQ